MLFRNQGQQDLIIFPIYRKLLTLIHWVQTIDYIPLLENFLTIFLTKDKWKKCKSIFLSDKKALDACSTCDKRKTNKSVDAEEKYEDYWTCLQDYCFDNQSSVKFGSREKKFLLTTKTTFFVLKTYWILDLDATKYKDFFAKMRQSKQRLIKMYHQDFGKFNRIKLSKSNQSSGFNSSGCIIISKICYVLRLLHIAQWIKMKS